MNKTIVVISSLVISTHAFAGVSFAKPSTVKPSFSKPSSTTAKPSSTKPNYSGSQRYQRPVVVTKQPQKSGLGVGHVLGAAAVAGAAGYYLGNSSNTSTPTNNSTHNTQSHAGNTHIYLPTVPGNKVITCITVNGTQCSYNNGMAVTKVSPQQYIVANGYTTLVNQSISFQNGQQFFILEVK